ncbi:MAG: ABC transporter ATP-binding protein [Candidatus Promineifilaceae bacterium]|nr:ABC transporter ATP-binding protein [Candidatus Promineifilaceae bacterium]
MSNLQATGLSLAYDKERIIDELDLRVQPGRITALVGPNGCGKSTLLRGLSRLLPAESGAVLLDGQAIHELPSKEVARRLGILPQSPVAPEGLTVRELVVQGRYPHQGWMQRWRPEDEQAVQDALGLTKTTDLADRPLDTLSGGQRQRAWIAMTLAQETEILLLDEPTTFLDMAYQIEVLDLLVELNQRGRTVVMVLHDLNLACRYAHHLVAMKGGQVVAQGAPKWIVTPALVREVFGLAAHIIEDPISGTPLCIPLGQQQSSPAPRRVAPATRPLPSPSAVSVPV